MAVKKSKAEGESMPKKATAKSASAPEAATKAEEAPQAAPKSTSTKAGTPKASAGTAAKAGTPPAATKAKASSAKAEAKKPAPIKLTDSQKDFLKEIHSAGEVGYKGDKKAKAKSLQSLLGKKLIKKGAKDKASGAYHYTVSKAGQKHLEEAPAS